MGFSVRSYNRFFEGDYFFLQMLSIVFRRDPTSQILTTSPHAATDHCGRGITTSVPRINLCIPIVTKEWWGHWSVLEVRPTEDMWRLEPSARGQGETERREQRGTTSKGVILTSSGAVRGSRC